MISRLYIPSVSIWSVLLILVAYPGKMGAQVLHEQTLTEIREHIRTTSRDLEFHHSERVLRDSSFNKINMQILQIQTDLDSSSNAILRFQLDQFLKESRRMATVIDSLNHNIQQTSRRLDELKSKAITLIDDSLQVLLRVGDPDVILPRQQKTIYEVVEKLEKEKLRYQKVALPSKHPMDWRLIRIEPGDTPARIRLKIAILSDHLTAFSLGVATNQVALADLKKNHKMYEEMLNFYKELERSTADEHEFFDRSRLDDLTDRLALLDKEMKTVNNQIEIKNATIDVLRGLIAQLNAWLSVNADSRGESRNE